MRQLILVPALTLAFALSVPVICAQQRQQSSDPYAPPPPPKPPSTQPDKGCSSQAVKGDGGPWKASSTCPPPAQNDVTPPLLPAQSDAKPQPKKSTAEENPFPEDISKKAEAEAHARDAEAGKSAPPPSAGESSSSDRTRNLDLEGERSSRLDNGAGGVIHDPKLAADDVHVGQFYLNREDYKGAYARFKEATQADPENPDAVFYLAEAARRMNLRDEATQNYKLYLAALPDGPKAKEAKKALRDMSASAKH
ncbi:MAG TPA: tetratricopeptide repeat protein [Alloacidobacterium sp.]|nr:tetratricopeptide repeat protein [Alloacidobacterium sp.]